MYAYHIHVSYRRITCVYMCIYTYYEYMCIHIYVHTYKYIYIHTYSITKCNVRQHIEQSSNKLQHT